MYTVTPRERVFTLAGVMVALFLGALDQTIVATAMPRILQELNGLALYTWVVTAYLLASTAMIPIWGKLSDLYGRKVVVLSSVVLFLLGSALSGQARSMVELIIFRAVQGLGSAGIFSTAFTVVADLFTPAERGRYQGLFGAVFGTSSVLGPWLGGLLTDHLSWRWVFYVNVPVGLVALAFIILQMPALKPQMDRKVRIDVWGVLTLLVAVVPLLLALSLGGQEYPWGSMPILVLFAVAAVGIGAFLLVERRAEEPILPWDLFQNRTYVIGNAAALFIAGVAFFGAILFLPIYMVLVVGVSASTAGLTVMPMTIGMVISSFVSGQLVSRVGRYKLFLLAGAAILFLGYLLMQGLTPDTTRWQVSWRMVILGIGLGPALPLYTLAIQNSVNPREIGAATSSSQFFRQIGAVVGVAVFGTILATTLSAQLPKYMPAGVQGAGAATISMGQLESGNFRPVGDQIRTRMQATYDKIEAVMLRGDESARQGLLADPMLPDAYKASLQSPAVPPSGQGAEERVKGILASIKDSMNHAADTIAAQVQSALKKAFTEAVLRIYFWGLFVVAAGFIFTLFLPEIALRTTHGHAPAGEGAVPPGAGDGGTSEKSPRPAPAASRE
ncbi:MAG TPA: MDR family MFS transporter [Spirochaetia bacterium]|nr:MDR family MFS transporter [Spirochaetia bacterium]